jgi:hypothetical protein
LKEREQGRTVEGWDGEETVKKYRRRKRRGWKPEKDIERGESNNYLT